MDKLKKHLQLNRSELDKEVPTEDVWNRVKERLRTDDVTPGNFAADSPDATSVRRLPEYVTWAVAAGLMLVIGLSALVLVQRDTSESKAMARLSVPQSTWITDSTIVASTSHVSQPTAISAKTITINPLTKHSPAKYRVYREPLPLPQEIQSIRASYTSMVARQLTLVEAKPIYAEDAGYFAYFRKQFAELVREEWVAEQKFRLDGYSDQSLEDLLGIYQQKITLLRKLQFEINRMNDKVTQTSTGKRTKPSYINL